LWTRKERFFSDADVYTFCCKKLTIFRKLCETVEKNVRQIRQLMTTIAVGRILLPFYSRIGREPLKAAKTWQSNIPDGLLLENCQSRGKR